MRVRGRGTGKRREEGRGRGEEERREGKGRGKWRGGRGKEKGSVRRGKERKKRQRNPNTSKFNPGPGRVLRLAYTSLTPSHTNTPLVVPEVATVIHYFPGCNTKNHQACPTQSGISRMSAQLRLGISFINASPLSTPKFREN